MVALGVVNGVFAGNDIPFAPWGDHGQMRRQSLVRQLKTHLVVAFSGRTVRQSVATRLQSHLHLQLG